MDSGRTLPPSLVMDDVPIFTTIVPGAAAGSEVTAAALARVTFAAPAAKVRR